ncbi:ribonuclease HI family protein [Patescibacteria group bacterium]|nr:MAG: ribonuclease HI family protein [Patescibacteria group bacterium]
MAHLLNAPVEIKHLVIHTDGGSRGNPGPSAVGVVISTPDDDHIESFGRYIGETTNNQAEYTAVIGALAAAKKYKPSKIELILDSELVVKQLRGEYKVKNVDLQPLHADIMKKVGGLEVTFKHVLRSENKLADIEVNKALDEHLGHI